eukprot:3152779-Rhodomonas_salina.1
MAILARTTENAVDSLGGECCHTGTLPRFRVMIILSASLNLTWSLPVSIRVRNASDEHRRRRDRDRDSWQTRTVALFKFKFKSSQCQSRCDPARSQTRITADKPLTRVRLRCCQCSAIQLSRPGVESSSVGRP